MSLKRVIRTLVRLGLPRVEAEVYIHLAKRGPVEMVNLANALSFSKQKLLRSLRNLQSIGIVTANPEGNKLLSALPFEKAIELLIEIRTEQAQIIQESREELLSSWREMKKETPEKS